MAQPERFTDVQRWVRAQSPLATFERLRANAPGRRRAA